MGVEDDDELDELRRRRRRQQELASKRTLLYVLIGGAAVGAVVLVVALAVSTRRPDKPGGDGGESGRAANVGTHKDLADLLRQKGVAVEMSVAAVVDRPDRPAVFFSTKGGAAGTRTVAYLCTDESAAREAAGTMRDGFTYGRFALGSYDSTPEALATTKAIRTALR
jgi:hypothetical protein